LTWVQAFALSGLGLAVGAIGTLIGAGGGFVLLPVLVLLYPQDSPALLTAISLTVVCANATSGSIAYRRMGRIDVRAGLWFAAAGLPGAVLGALLTHRLDHRLFDPLLGGVLLMGAGFILLSPTSERREATSGTRTLVERDGTTHIYTPRLTLGALLSVGIGFLSSLVGIGGGIIHVPVMVYLLGFPTHIATATSHFVLAILALSAVITHAATGTLGPVIGRLLPIIIGVLAGAQFGAWASSRIHGRWILRGLAIALAIVGVRLLFHP
jgi:uncharacterized membrane protein YfcA